MNELRIEYHNPQDLKPYDNNAREHNEEDIDAIRASIREFGFNDPIGIWSDENLIVEGHGRQLAAVSEGLTEVPCIRLDHLTDEQRRAYALAHNKTAELSQWDFMSLDMELAGIEEIDMTAFGFMPVQAFESEAIEEESAEEVEKLDKHYGVPYQGNKSRIADMIISILPEGKRLVDLFGGAVR